MANNLYGLFGLDETCTDEQLDAAYGTLRSQYAEDRFLEGEAGNIAAKKLTELDNAYRDIIAMRREAAGGNPRATLSVRLRKKSRTATSRARRANSIRSTNVTRSGIICSRLCSIRKNGRTRVKNNSKSQCRWIRPTKNIKPRITNSSIKSNPIRTGVSRVIPATKTESIIAATKRARPRWAAIPASTGAARWLSATSL